MRLEGLGAVSYIAVRRSEDGVMDYEEQMSSALDTEQGELVWDTSGEREAQERARRRTEERRGEPVTWDDKDEKACMEAYRKKYS